MIENYIYIFIIFLGYLAFRFYSKTDNRSSLSECSICNEIFDEIYILEIEDMPFCKKHAKDFIDKQWVIADQVDCTPENQQESVDLYERKLNDFKNGTQGFIKTTYREESGQIISTLSYFKEKKEL